MKKKIAVCGNGWSNEYIEIALSGIRKCAKLNNTDVFFLFNFSVGDTEEYMQEGQININRLLEYGNFDGVILLANTFHMQSEFDYLCNIVKVLDIPCVTLEYPLPGIDFFGSDNYSGMHELCTHLVEHHSYKDFVYISGPENNAESDIRKKALTDVLTSHGLSLPEENVICGNWNYYEVERQLPLWLASHPLPDVFVCANDVMAMAACSILRANDITVPNDVKVTGFDHLLSTRNYYPTIASVDRNWDNLGYRSLEYLLDKIEGAPSIPEYYVDSYAVPGESCGCNPPDTISLNKRVGATNVYESYVRSSFWSGHLCDIADCLSTISNEEGLNSAITNFIKNDHSYEGDEFYLCLVDNFFSSLMGGPALTPTGYTDRMNVICNIKDGQPRESVYIDTKDLFPGYDCNGDCGQMYTFFPLLTREGCYGYAVLGSEVPMIYDYSAYNWMRSIAQNLQQVRRNITISELNKQLEQLSVTDGLTGVYNRLGCDKIVYPYLEKCHSQGINTVLMFSDINKMKVINDKFGHLAGDTAICTVAKVLTEALPDNWHIARYGGDEFLMIGEYCKEQSPDYLIENINSLLRETTDRMQFPYSLSIGIGYVIIDASEELDLQECLRKADEAMYLTKWSQKGNTGNS